MKEEARVGVGLIATDELSSRIVEKLTSICDKDCLLAVKGKVEGVNKEQEMEESREGERLNGGL